MLVLFGVLLCGIFLLGFNSRFKFNHCYWFFFIITFLVSALRYNVGYDYLTYYLFIVEQNQWALNFLELIPTAIIQLSISLNEPSVFFIITSCFILFFFFKTIIDNFKSQEEIFIAVMVYICIFWLDSLSIIRQEMAIAVLLYGYKYIKEKKLFKYIIIVIIAGNCHTTSYIALIIYFFQFMNSKYTIPIIFILCIFSRIIFMNTLNIVDYRGYLDYAIGLSNSQGGNKIAFFYLILDFLILIFAKNKNQISDPIFCLCSTVICGAIPCVIFMNLTGVRIGLYFHSYLILLIPKIYRNYITKNTLLYCLSLYYLSVLVIDYFNDRGYSNYSLYLFK